MHNANYIKSDYMTILHRRKKMCMPYLQQKDQFLLLSLRYIRSTKLVQIMSNAKEYKTMLPQNTLIIF